MSDDWSFNANIERGELPTGEPLEALYGTGWWTEEPKQPDCPPGGPCPECGGSAYDLGDCIDCENCGKIPYPSTGQKVGG